jgi:hypothetical protein
MVTTYSDRNIGTDIGNYFVSTIQSIDNLGYSTILKNRGLSNKILEIYADTAKNALINHVAVARMVMSEKENNWSFELVNKYRPTVLVATLDKEKLSVTPENFTSEYCKSLFNMSGLNAIERKPIFLKLPLIIIFLLIAYYLIHKFF